MPAYSRLRLAHVCVSYACRPMRNLIRRVT